MMQAWIILAVAVGFFVYGVVLFWRHANDTRFSDDRLAANYTLIFSTTVLVVFFMMKQHPYTQFAHEQDGRFCTLWEYAIGICQNIK